MPPPCSWVQLLEKEGKIAKFVPIDFSDADTVFEQCLAVRSSICETLSQKLASVSVSCLCLCLEVIGSGRGETTMHLTA